MAAEQCYRAVHEHLSCPGAEASEEKKKKIEREIGAYHVVLNNEEAENADSAGRGEDYQVTDGFQSELASSANTLSELPLKSSGVSTIKDESELHQDNQLSGAEDAVQYHTLNHLESLGYYPSSEFSHVSATPSISSSQMPTATRQRRLNDECMRNVLEKNTVLNGNCVRAPPLDGYSWRKYGQKQVKYCVGSRSYYRCTYPDCHAKKLELCDASGGLMELVYRGEHNHEPPRRANHVKGRLSVAADNGKTNSIIPTIESDVLPSSEGSINGASRVIEQNQNSDGHCILDLKTEDDCMNEMDSIPRSTDASLANPSSSNLGKNELVVYATGDMGIPSDGYRWRKYGQKMVKGNQFPRNYYRCTSAGCTVRKHIEKSIDEVDAVVITYKGLHDHDAPVPKRPYASPIALPLAYVSPMSMQSTKGEDSSHEVPTRGLVRTDGRLDVGHSMDTGGDKVMESARTLLSIGYEVKPC